MRCCLLRWQRGGGGKSYSVSRISVTPTVCPTHRTLVLHKCVHLTEAGLSSVLTCEGLTVLDVSHCPVVNDTFVEGVTTRLRRLKVINLTACLLVSPRAFMSLLLTCVHR